MGRSKELIPPPTERELEYLRQRDEWKQQQIDHTIQKLKEDIQSWKGERNYTLGMMEDIVRCLENGDRLSQIEIDWLNNKI